MVVLDGEALGKPADGVEASRMLKRLAGREHAVVTAVALVDPGGASATGFGRSVVAFGDLSHEDIAEYIASGEPMDKAGGYAIQGDGGAFAALVSGSLDTVIGLPLHVLRQVARRLGHPGLRPPG